MTVEEQKERERLIKDLVGADSNKSYEAHLKLKAMKAREESQKRRDPQWIPSDAEMINWVEANCAIVCNRVFLSGMWTVGCLGKDWGFGPTWRAAVEDAMRKEAKLQE